jgi:flavodoxin
MPSRAPSRESDSKVTDGTGPLETPPASLCRVGPAQETTVKKAIVVYRSHSGVTRRYGEEIAAFLTAMGIAAQVVSVGECDTATLADADYLLLGCWTSGLFVIRQHPDEPWLAFVREMPNTPRPKVALFTTYQLRTGSQFPKMRAALAGKTASPRLELKSRDGHLSAADERSLEQFLA